MEFCGAFRKFRGEGTSLAGFLRGYAKMVARRAARGPVWDRRRSALDFDPANDELDPQETLVAREQLRRLESALAKLSARKRNALMLWAVEGRSAGEISELTDASIAAVRSRIFYAQKELRIIAGEDPYLAELLE
jgi:RNA polymerase sigma factor (sigma-70 family)